MFPLTPQLKGFMLKVFFREKKTLQLIRFLFKFHINLADKSIRKGEPPSRPDFNTQYYQKPPR